MSARFDVDAAVARTASRQCGAFSLDQGHAAGADEELVTRRVASDLWIAAELHRLDGFPTTTAARTLIDLAAVVSYTRLRVATQDLVVRRLSTFGDLADVLRELRRRGKPGIRKAVKVLDSLDGDSPPASMLERLLLGVIERAGLVASPQHPLPTHEPIRGLVDFALDESKLILEADGRLWHARLQAMVKDRPPPEPKKPSGLQTRPGGVRSRCPPRRGRRPRRGPHRRGGHGRRGRLGGRQPRR